MPLIITAVLTLTACSSADSGSESALAASQTETESSVTAITYEIDPNKPLVALTFDDGPNITTTVQVLDILEKYQVPASFFLVGNNITPASSEVVKRAYDMGCEIDNHSKTHSYMNKKTQEEISAEVTFVSDKVKEITGEPTKFFRPPFIAVNSDMYEAIDMPFICGVGCNDWDQNVTVQQRIDNTLSQVNDGTIILLHDSAGNSQTVEALDTIIPSLIDEGYQFVTVSELFETKGVEISGDDSNLYTLVQ
ncbi:MAG: polysaccharide deacetylase family protein [Oscillospiraceae bacterium]|nr:polysaccharide deacetylase family protein [Oscillospiraceae bacterium]